MAHALAADEAIARIEKHAEGSFRSMTAVSEEDVEEAELRPPPPINVCASVNRRAPRPTRRSSSDASAKKFWAGPGAMPTRSRTCSSILFEKRSTDHHMCHAWLGRYHVIIHGAKLKEGKEEKVGRSSKDNRSRV